MKDEYLLPSYLQAGISNPATIVFLHGIGSTSLTWQPSLASFSSTRRVLAWNAPGYADSAPIASDAPVIADYAQRLSDLLDSVNVKAATVVASSWGATIAMSLASRHPHHVSRLVLSGPTAGFAHLSERDRLDMHAARARRATELGLQEMFAQDAAKPATDAAASGARHVDRAGVNLAGYLQALRTLFAFDGVATAAQVMQPTLIICGELDTIAPPDKHARRLAAALPAASIQELTSCGHLPHQEQPQAFHAAVKNFIA